MITISSKIQGYVKAHFAKFITDWKKPEPFDWRALLACIVGGIALVPLTIRMPILGHDWFVYFFIMDRLPPTSPYSIPDYPPWTHTALLPFTQGTGWEGLALLNGFLFMTVAVAAARESRGFSRNSRLGAAVLAVATPIVPIVLWQGNIAGLVLLGLVGMPLTLPYLLIQPNFSWWAILARRSWMIWAVIFGILTVLIWGWWPPGMLATLANRLAHPIAMGWQQLGFPVIVIGLVMLVFTNADPLRLIAVGSFITPYIMPGHLLLLLPAIGRAQGINRLILWLASWLLLLPIGFTTNWSKYVAMLFPLAVWWLLRPKTAVEDPSSIVLSTGTN